MCGVDLVTVDDDSGVTSVLVKAPKSRQDLRFDLPAVGPRTVKGAAAASLAGIAIEAGNTIAIEPQTMIEFADAAGLFYIGLPA